MFCTSFERSSNICLKTEVQGYGMTFKVCNFGSKQPYFNSSYAVTLLLFSELYLTFLIFNIAVKQEGQIVEIEKVSIHPGYRHPKAYNDLSVIKIRPSKGNSMNIAKEKCLYTIIAT